VITDQNVNKLYHHDLQRYPLIEFAAGEEHKTLETVEFIYHRLLELGADRSSFLVGVGGGVVCDITGYAAATYMRGLDFGYVATTLLAQVDASVGGKTAVNFHGFKNMVGVFNQPRFVLCDIDLLKTLPREDIINGLAEVTKHALIGDSDLFHDLEAQPRKILDLDRKLLEDTIERSLRVKIGIVEKDEREVRERRWLNFGHTFGHALESLAGLPHGRAVSWGMKLAVQVSVRKGRLQEDVAARILRLLEVMGLLPDVHCDASQLKKAVRTDKKKTGDALKFVLLQSIGRPVVEDIPLVELESLIDDLC
jgi:3-dehydroquinate synthase